MSDKSVFGQCGPKSIIYLCLYKYISFSQRTICREFIDISILLNLINKVKSLIFKILLIYLISKVQNTKNVSSIFYSFMVKIFVQLNNPQITNAQIIIYIMLSKFKIIYFFGLSMLVGISEAICSLLTFLFSFIINSPLKNNFQARLNFLSFFSNTKKVLPFYYYNLLPLYSFFTLHLLCDNSNIKNKESNSFDEWVSGIIDGDGCFLLSKKDMRV